MRPNSVKKPNTNKPRSQKQKSGSKKPHGLQSADKSVNSDKSVTHGGRKPETASKKGKSSNTHAKGTKKKPNKVATERMNSRSVPSKKGLHPRNPHRDQYDFNALTACCPDLTPFIELNPFGNPSVNFSDPKAVKMLNKALLQHFYHVEHWDIPDGYLCPPIPGRADYLHYIADLLSQNAGGHIPKGKQVRGLDIGTGANCVYPIIGHSVYGWQFVAADIDPISVKAAKFIVSANKALDGHIDCRLQANPDNILNGMIGSNDRFDFTMCNPPFHASLAEATAGSARKVRNLQANARKKGTLKSAQYQKAKGQPVLNFGGQKAELWCPGGEAAFLKRMVIQSQAFAMQCLWFTSLVSKKENLPLLRKQLQAIGAVEVKVIEMEQGQKITRLLAWTFKSKQQQKEWYADNSNMSE